MNIDASALKELKVYFNNESGSNDLKLTVISAYKLGNDEKDLLTAFLAKNGLKECKLEEEVDKGVLGGIMLVAGSTVIDLS